VLSIPDVPPLRQRIVAMRARGLAQRQTAVAASTVAARSVRRSAARSSGSAESCRIAAFPQDSLLGVGHLNLFQRGHGADGAA